MRLRLGPAAGAAALALLGAGAVAAPAGAGNGAQSVSIVFQAYTPQQIDVLPGETVQWTNTVDRRHTVTADDGSYDSGDLYSGDRFSQRFVSPGAYTYHCSVHPGMTGEVDVRRLILDPAPDAPVAPGDRVTFSGRSADGAAPVSLQSDSGSGFVTVASATPASDGSWSASVPVSTAADFRAVSGADVSETRRVLVADRHVLVRATSRGLVATVTPPDPGASILVEELLRERFGWWPVARVRLGHGSRVAFTLPPGVPGRVVLVAGDGWTPLVISSAVRRGR